jgi:hypothetical protein
MPDRIAARLQPAIAPAAIPTKSSSVATEFLRTALPYVVIALFAAGKITTADLLPLLRGLAGMP